MTSKNPWESGEGGRRGPLSSGVVSIVATRVCGMIAGNPEIAFHAFATYVCLLALIQVFTIGLSLCRVPLVQPVAWSILLASILGAGYYWRSGRAKTEPSELSRFGRTHLAFITFCLAAYLFLWFTVLRKPDLTWDGNEYHLPTMHFWALRGYVHWVTVPGMPDVLETCINGYSKAVELTGFLLVKAFGTNRVAEAGNLLFLPAGVLGLVYLASALGASPLTAILAGCAYVLVPVNITQGVNTYVDSGYASSAIAFIAAVCYTYVKMRGGRLPWNAAIAVGAGLGLAIGAKGTGLTLGVIGLGFLFGSWIITRLMRASDERLTLLRAGAWFALIALATMSVGGFWYLRNWVVAGNPIYPVELKVAGHVLFSGIPLEEQIRAVAVTPQEMLPWPGFRKIFYTWCQGFREWPGSLIPYDARLGGLGYLWLFGCVPAILLVVLQRFRARLKKNVLAPTVLLPLFLITTAAFLTTPLNWWARYTAWVYAAGLPCFAAVVDKLSERGVLRWMSRSWTLLCLAVFALEGLYALCWVGSRTHCYDDGWKPLPENPIEVARMLVKPCPKSYIFTNLNGTAMESVLHSDATVALGALRRPRHLILGQFCQPLGVRGIVLLSDENLKDAERTAKFLREHDVRYVIWDNGIPLPSALERTAARVERIPNFIVLEIAASPRD
ncbi:MAG: hypothetical protein HY706_19970 [Candidatus Hydrogenedentes bacterium]|nr:hypothetical protein [Candidatus Hydrogenedentota bacterium]